MDDLDDYIDIASGLIGLEIAHAYRPGVRRFLLVAQEMAELAEAAPLEENEFALAPVYLPRERSL